MERFFTLKHLSKEQLHDLFAQAVKVGKLLVEYDKPGEEWHYDVRLPQEDILRNIRSGDHNYAVFHENEEDFDDATSFAFPLVNHPNITAYVDVDNELLDWFAEKYNITEWWQMEGSERRYYPFSEFRTTPAGDGIIIRIDPKNLN